jgi:hypothetical protein
MTDRQIKDLVKQNYRINSYEITLSSGKVTKWGINRSYNSTSDLFDGWIFKVFDSRESAEEYAFSLILKWREQEA